MTKLLLTFCIIICSLGLGYAAQCAVVRGRWRPAIPLHIVRRRLLVCGMFFFLPSAAMLSLWGLHVVSPYVLCLPLLGICSWLTGGGLALWASRSMGLSSAQTGSMLCCGAMSNIGAVGGLVCVVFVGESSVALVALYRLCEEMLFFGLLCPLARRYAHTKSAGEVQHLRGALYNAARDLIQDRALRLVLIALACGLLLNVLGIPRFAGAGGLASVLVVLATVCFLVGIGMGLRISRLGDYMRHSLVIIAIKSLCVPCVVVGLAIVCTLGSIENGAALRVVLILSAMPVAMNALVPPALYGLDVDMANACWVWSTAALVFVLPALLILLPYI